MDEPGKGTPAAAEPKTVTMTQVELDAMLQANAAKIVGKYADYDALKTKATEFDKLTEEQKTELQRATEKAQGLQGEVAKLAPENLRLRVALAKGLPAELVDRLQGATKEELEADADKLASLVKPKPAGLDGGAHGAVTDDTDMNARIRHAAGRA